MSVSFSSNLWSRTVPERGLGIVPGCSSWAASPTARNCIVGPFIFVFSSGDLFPIFQQKGRKWRWWNRSIGSQAQRTAFLDTGVPAALNLESHREHKCDEQKKRETEKEYGMSLQRSDFNLSEFNFWSCWEVELQVAGLTVLQPHLLYLFLEKTEKIASKTSRVKQQFFARASRGRRLIKFCKALQSANCFFTASYRALAL